MSSQNRTFIVASYVHDYDLETFMEYTTDGKTVRDIMNELTYVPGCSYDVHYQNGSLWVERVHENDGPKGRTLYFAPMHAQRCVDKIKELIM